MTAALVALTAWLLLGRDVAAHPAPFSYLDVRIGAQSLSGRLVLHDLDVAHELSLAAETLADPAVVQGRSASIAQLVSGRLVLQADGAFVAWKVTNLRPLPDQSAVELEWTAAVARTPGRITSSYRCST